MSDTLPTRTYPPGWTSYTVFDTEYPASSFNPHAGFGTADAGVGGRFHPFVDPAGVPVPTKYLGDHPIGAFAETLMRDDLGHRSVSLDAVRHHGIATVAFAREMVLADLVVDVVASPTLHGLLESGRKAYPALRTVARALHARHDRIDGLVWQGRQLGAAGMNCTVLFGDRVKAAVDLIETGVHALDRDLGLQLLRDAARARRFALPDALVLDGPRASPEVPKP